MNKRFEINYLKGVAVLLIIFYNANFKFFSSGLIGLDIFFVVAGYLTTLSILNDLYNKNFSLSKFYEKKLQRLLPTFLLICLLTVFVITFSIPKETLLISKLLVNSVLFISNIYLWNNPIGELNILSHTWFLSLILQFYLLFPLFLMYFYNLNKNTLMLFFLGILILSLILSSYGSIYGRGLGTFYLLPFRGWEFLFGILIAQNEKYILKNISNSTSNILSFIGLILILTSLFIFDKNTPFPSFYNLVPVMGVSLVILFYKKNFFEKIYINRFICLMGKISYSIFLFHIPIFYIYKRINLKIPNDFEMLLLCIFTIIIAYLNTIYLEKKIIKIFKFNKKLFYNFLVILTFGFILIGLLGIKTNGYHDLIIKHKFNSDQKYLYTLFKKNFDHNLYETSVNKDCKIFSFNFNDDIQKKFNDCSSKHGSAILLVGDSLAMNLHNILAKTGDIKFIFTITGGGCRIKSYPEESCFYKELSDFISNNRTKIKKILYHDNGMKLLIDKKNEMGSQIVFDTKKFNINEKRLDNIIKNLNDYGNLNNSDLIWIGPKISYVYKLDRVLFWDEAKKIHEHSREVHKELEKKIKTNLTSLINFKYIDFEDIYSIEDNILNQNCLFWADGTHISNCGEDIISQSKSLNNFAKQINNI